MLLHAFHETLTSPFLRDFSNDNVDEAARAREEDDVEVCRAVPVDLRRYEERLTLLLLFFFLSVREEIVEGTFVELKSLSSPVV